MAVSNDGRLLVCEMDDDWVIYDWKKQTKKILPRQIQNIKEASFSYDNNFLITDDSILNLVTDDIKDLDDIPWSSVSPYEHKLAWNDGDSIIIYDYERNERQNIKVKGKVGGWIGWSPDGRFVVYFCVLNPFTHNGWEVDIRITDIKTGASATVCQNFFTGGRWYKPIWIK